MIELKPSVFRIVGFYTVPCSSTITTSCAKNRATYIYLATSWEHATKVGPWIINETSSTSLPEQVSYTGPLKYLYQIYIRPKIELLWVPRFKRLWIGTFHITYYWVNAFKYSNWILNLLIVEMFPTLSTYTSSIKKRLKLRCFIWDIIV